MLGTWYPLYNSKFERFNLDLKRCQIAEIQAWNLEKEKGKILTKPYDLDKYNGFKVK